MRPIFVTGPPRSGTSMTTRLLVEHGCWCGDCIEADEHNKAGYFENKAIVEIVKSLLKKNGTLARSDSQPPKKWAYNPDNLRGMILKHVDASGPWVFKDSKLLLVSPLMRKAFPEALWVFTMRNIEDNITSLLKHKIWARRYVQAKNVRDRLGEMIRDLWLLATDLEVKVDYVWAVPGSFVAKKTAAEAFIDACGLRFDKKAYNRAINKELWHGRI